MIIQSLIHEPKLIIADEPTENLDPITRETFYQVIRHLSQNGVSILISTHNLDEIQRHIDYLIIIFDGKTKYVGDAKTKDLFAIYSSYQKPVKL
jgi:ABC-type multidrug transport system ATPase subunit